MTSIESIIESLGKITRIFSHFIQESNFVRTGNSITWPNFKRGFSKALYMKEYEELLKQRQYSFLLSDKSFIQCYFEFDNEGGIKTIKYAYYPYPIPLTANLDVLEEYFDNNIDNAIGQYYYDLLNLMGEELGLEIDDIQRQNTIAFFRENYNIELNTDDVRSVAFDKIYSLTNYSHLRMDFDAGVATHHKCEFQFGAIKQIRIPFSKILTPFIFTDFVFRYFFKSEYPSLVANYTYKKEFIKQKRSCLAIEGFFEESFYNVIDFERIPKRKRFP